MNVSEINDADFQSSVAGADTPVLVDFWAPWCGPCKNLAPVLEDFAAKNDGQVKVVKINVDENPQSAQQFGVRGLPTLLLMKGGNVAGARSGAMSAPQLDAWVKETL